MVGRNAKVAGISHCEELSGSDNRIRTDLALRQLDTPVKDIVEQIDSRLSCRINDKLFKPAKIRSFFESQARHIIHVVKKLLGQLLA